MRNSILLTTLFLISISLAGQNNFVYTNDSAFPNTVSAFRVNSNGSLALIPGSPFPAGGNGGGSDVNAGKITTATRSRSSFLYAGNNSDATVSAFRIDSTTGHLTPVAGSPFPAGTPHPSLNFSLASSPNGRFLFVTDEVSMVVRVFSIRHDGELVEQPGSPFNVGALSEGLKVSPNGRFLVVGLKSINAVGVFAIDHNGDLTAVSGSPFPASGAATAVDIDCESELAFASNAGLHVIDSYHMDEDGRLTPVSGSPFPSGGTSTINAFTLNDQHLFASNLFNGTVSSLAISENGSLQAVPGSPFSDADSFVGGIAATRSGRLLYASLVTEAAVAGWSISANGALTLVPGGPFFTGRPGQFVLSLTTFPAPTCRRNQDDDDDHEQGNHDD
jgi:6-phosphogluconolactonase (cycloisomerase 2 family)